MSSATRRLPRPPLVLIVMALFVVWLLMDTSLGDYLPFRSTPEPESADFQELTGCAGVRADARAATEQAESVPEDSMIRPQALGYAALIVTQNPRCFQSQVVADAHSLLYGTD
ncbi:MAG: hypothetical protein WDZ26_03040 [Nitriliruptoraceae bacterium]